MSKFKYSGKGAGGAVSIKDGHGMFGIYQTFSDLFFLSKLGKGVGLGWTEKRILARDCHLPV